MTEVNNHEQLIGTKYCFVYILQCADDTLYTGWTDNLEKRLQAHNSGRGAKYTRSRLPVKLVYWETQSDMRSALRREAEIKKMSRRQKLALIAKSIYHIQEKNDDY